MSILIIGAGGHAKVVADILLTMNRDVLGYVDDAPSMWNSTLLGLPVLGPIDRLHELQPTGIVCAIGSNSVRRQIAERLGTAFAGRWINAVHPSAVLACTARLGTGIVVAAGAVINPDTVLGDHAIVNTGATVDHDCQIGDFAHIAPGAHLAGGVRVGAGTLVGIGSAVIPNKSIGQWATIGAGATVVYDIPDGVTAVGTPASWAR